MAEDEHESPEGEAPQSDATPPLPDVALPPLEELGGQDGGGSAGPPAFDLPEALAFLRNRFALAAVGIVVVMLLVAIVLVAIGGGDADGPRPAALDDNTPQADVTVAPRAGLAGRVLTTAIMRSGPGRGFAILGTIPQGASVTVVGRNANDTWLQVIPPSSQLRAWLEVDFVQVTGDISQLVIAGASAGPSIAVPTSPPPPRPRATNTPPPRATNTPPAPITPTAPPPTPTRPPATPTPPRTPATPPGG